MADKKWICGKCNKVFLHKQSLHRHKYSLCGTAKYKCETCAKQFNRLDTLKTHKKNCKGKKSTVCAACKKEFPTPWNLKRHILQSHSVEKKSYSCSQCHRSFTRIDHYKSHLKKCNSKTVSESFNLDEDILFESSKIVLPTRFPSLVAAQDVSALIFEDSVVNAEKLINLSLLQEYFLDNNESAPTMVELDSSIVNTETVDFSFDNDSSYDTNVLQESSGIFNTASLSPNIVSLF